MPSSFSPSLRIELIAPGEQAGTWNVTTNRNLGTLLEDAIAGYDTVSVVSASQALTASDGVADQSRNAILRLTTTTSAPFSVYAPPVSKQYTVFNDTAHNATVFNSTVTGNTTAAGTGVIVPAGKTLIVYSDGTDFRTVDVVGLTGVLAIANGGTGATTAAGARTNLGTVNDPGSNGILVRTAANTTTPRAVAVSGTGLSVTNGDGVAGNPTVTSNATNANTGSTIVARDGSGNFSAGTITAALSGNASTATALQTARTIGGVSFNGTANINLPGVNTAGNQNTSGNAATATTLQTARTINGVSFNGSANITLPTVNTSGNQTVDGVKTFSSTITGSVSGNAGTATALQTARTIGGVSFNGTANINLPGVNTAGNQNTSGNAATATTATNCTRSITAGTGLTGGGALTADRTLSIANGGVGATQLASNQQMTTANVLGVTAGASALAVGTYALLRAVAGGPFVAGNTYTGNNLSEASASGAPTISGNNIVIVGGTWRCMGRSDAGTLTTAARANETTLWLRIS